MYQRLEGKAIYRIGKTMSNGWAAELQSSKSGVIATEGRNLTFAKKPEIQDIPIISRRLSRSTEVLEMTVLCSSTAALFCQ